MTPLELVQVVEDCIVKLEHLGAQPFHDTVAYAKWCQSMAIALREALENSDIY